MRQKSVEAVFRQINESYDSLMELAGRENVEVERKRLRDELVIAVCGIYFKLHIGCEEIDAERETYSAEIVEKTLDCIAKFDTSSSRQKGVAFSQYVCTSVRNMLAELKRQDSFGKKSGGQHISRDALSLMNKVKDQDRVFEGFGVRDEVRRNKKIAFSLGISEEKVLEMKRLLSLSAVPDEKDSDDGGTFSLIDEAGIRIDYSSAGRKEQKEKLEQIFACIQEEWEEKSDSELSEILTADILAMFKGKDMGKMPDEKENCVSLAAGLAFDLEKFVSGYSFIDKLMSAKFFSEAGYELPSQVELAAKFSKTKSGICKQLSRFYEKVSRNEKIREFRK